MMEALMTEIHPSYRLHEEPAVPVGWLAADMTRAGGVSLRDALVCAHVIRSLWLEPLPFAAVMTRVLVPLAIDIFGIPADLNEWARRWEAREFEAEEVDRYFAEHGERFDLFHPKYPFDQVAGLRTAKNEVKPISILSPTAPAGNNVPLWAACLDTQSQPLAPMSALAALEVTQALDTAAIKSGAVGDPRVRGGKTTGNPTGTLGALGVVIPLGQSLFETIMLNTPVADGPVHDGISDHDSPHWRRPPATPAWDAAAVPAGILDLMTWQSRRIRLVADALGEDAPRVRGAVVSAGDRLVEVPRWDPRTQWRRRKNRSPGQSLNVPVRHVPGRVGWQGLSSLLAIGANTSDQQGPWSSHLITQAGDAFEDEVLPADYPLNAMSVGVIYGNQSAVVESVVVDDLPLPLLALSSDAAVRRAVLDLGDQADQIRLTLNHLASDLRFAAGGESIEWDKGNHPGDELMGSLDAPVRKLLLALREPSAVLATTLRDWEFAAYSLAEDSGEVLLNAAPTLAFRGRQSGDYRIDTFHAERKFKERLRDILPLEAERRRLNQNTHEEGSFNERSSVIN
jgi:CRISPR system Cascade subunit CasA